MIARTVRLPEGRATPQQRLYVRTLMEQLELDVRYFTASHRRFFEAASLPVPDPEGGIDAALCALTKEQASALIKALKKEIPDEA